MSTTSKFQAYKKANMPTQADVAHKPKYNIKTKSLSGPELQQQYNAGKVPESLAGMVILKRQKHDKTGDVIGWHWITPTQFDKKYTTVRRLVGKLKNDPYFNEWKQKGLV